MPAGSPVAPEPLAAPPVILIVEDDHVVAQAFRDVLETGGYAVVHADRGDAALAILATPSCAVDLVLLDLVLPDIHGLQLLPALRDQAADPRLAVIIVTGRGMPADRVAAIKGEAYDFLVKPVVPEELLARVGMALSRRRLERERLELAALCRMAKAVNSSLDLNAVLDRGLEHAIAALGADSGSIRVYEGEQGSLSLKTHRGLPFGLIQRLRRTPPTPELVSLRSPLVVDLLAPPPTSCESFHTEVMLFREAGYRRAILIPLAAKTAGTGILSIYSKRHSAMTDQDMAFLVAIGDQISTAADNARFHEEMATRALTDALTGLSNRRHFVDRMREEIARAIRSPRPLALLLLDLDHFKPINDGWGHPVGDEILRKVAAILRATLRWTDLIARYGGDEFAALIMETPRRSALHAAERLRKAVEEQAYAIGMPGESLHVTISIGLATVPEDGSTLEDLLERADRALYLAKESGGNRVRTGTDTGAGSTEPS